MGSIEISATEQGVIRVFAISRPIASMARALKQASKVSLATELLGHPVTEGDVELFALSDLTGVGLPGYLTDGYDIDANAMRADRAKLDALDGYVLLVFSTIGGTASVCLTPDTDLTLIGTYFEPKRKHVAAPVAVEAAMPYTGHSPDPTAAKRSRIGSAVGAIAVLAILILIWWILT